MSNKKTFPELRAIMAKYGFTMQQMGGIIGNTYQTFSKKLDEESEFSFSDMVKIKDYFKGIGEDVTIDKIFFDWKFTIVNTQMDRR